MYYSKAIKIYKKNVKTDGNACYQLGYMYYNKFELNSSAKKEISNSTEIANKGAEGVIESTTFDYEQSYKKAMELSGYPKERE